MNNNMNISFKQVMKNSDRQEILYSFNIGVQLTA